MDSSRREVELEEQLKEAANLLLTPPSDVDELNNLLDRLERLLTYVEQAPPITMQDALLPTMKALKANQLLRHPNADVRISVASCLSEVMRITAPESPYDDDLMKEIFKLTVEAFKRLSNVSGRCFTKAVSILDTAARVRSSLMMLDLECDTLIIEMFQIFLKLIRSDHPGIVFLAMETIMTLVLEESEDVSLDLLSVLLDSVRKENQDLYSVSYKLGEKVITNCASKLKFNLIKAVRVRGIHLDEYAEIVGSICDSVNENLQHDNLIDAGENTVTKEHSPDTPEDVCNDMDGISKSMTSNGTTPTRSKDSGKDSKSSKTSDAGGSAKPENLDSPTTVKLETEIESTASRRGRKPNSLMNPEEGYEWNSAGRKTPKISGSRKSQDKVVSSPSRKSEPKKSVHKKVGDSASAPSQKDSDHDTNHPNEDCAKRKRSTEARQSEDSGLKRKAGERFDTQRKRRKCSVKSGLAVKIKEEISPTKGVSENNDLSSDQLDIDKGNTALSSDKVVSKASISMKTKRISEKVAKPSNRNGSFSEERQTPKTPQAKRKHSAKRELDSKASEFGEELVGSKIKVLWPMDKAFYEGVVDSFDPIKKKHRILYVDGDEEILNLKRERWELIGNHILDQETDGSKPDESSDTQQNEHEKTNSDPAKELKADSSSKRQQKKKVMVKIEPSEEPELKDVSFAKRNKASGSACKPKVRKSAGISKDGTKTKMGAGESIKPSSSAKASTANPRKSVRSSVHAAKSKTVDKPASGSSAKASKVEVRKPGGGSNDDAKSMTVDEPASGSSVKASKAEVRKSDGRSNDDAKSMTVEEPASGYSVKASKAKVRKSGGSSIRGAKPMTGDEPASGSSAKASKTEVRKSGGRSNDGAKAVTVDESANGSSAKASKAEVRKSGGSSNDGDKSVTLDEPASGSSPKASKPEVRKSGGSSKDVAKPMTVGEPASGSGKASKAEGKKSGGGSHDRAKKTRMVEVSKSLEGDEKKCGAAKISMSQETVATLKQGEGTIRRRENSSNLVLVIKKAKKEDNQLSSTRHQQGNASVA